MPRLVAALVAISLLLPTHAAPAAAASRDCDRWAWHFSLDLPAGFWAEGSHVYEIRSNLAGGQEQVFTVAFDVDQSHPLVKGEVLFLLFGPLGRDGRTFALNPAQDTAFQVGFFHGGTMATVDRAQAEATADATGASFRWDGMTEWIVVERSPVMSICAALTSPARFLRDWGRDFEAN